MLDNIFVNCHSSIKIILDKIIYFDPYCIDRKYSDADYIFITHSHYDHFSKEDIEKIIKENTKVILPKGMYGDAIKKGIDKSQIISVVPGDRYIIDNIKLQTIPAYNIKNGFHQKSANWVGYIMRIDNTIYYIAGDTDITDEAKSVSCDISFIPIGGEYTMDYSEAAELVNIIKPKYVIPIHYGKIVGEKKDGEKFKGLVDKSVQCIIKI